MGDGIRTQAENAGDERTTQAPEHGDAGLPQLGHGMARANHSLSRAWSPANVAALQRTAGNAAVAGLLRGSPTALATPAEAETDSVTGRDGKRPPARPGPRMLQRRLAIWPSYLGQGGKGTYGQIKKNLADYHQVPEVAAQHGLLQIMKGL